MAKSSSWRHDLLLFIFHNVAFAGLGLGGSEEEGSLYVSLHTGDPSEGDQSSSEVSYDGYERVKVQRSEAGWVVIDDHVSPVEAITFPISTDGSDVAVYVGIGVEPHGAGYLMYCGLLADPITCSVGVTPQLTPDSTLFES